MHSLHGWAPVWPVRFVTLELSTDLFLELNPKQKTEGQSYSETSLRYQLNLEGAFSDNLINGAIERKIFTFESNCIKRNVSCCFQWLIGRPLTASAATSSTPRPAQTPKSWQAEILMTGKNGASRGQNCYFMGYSRPLLRLFFIFPTINSEYGYNKILQMTRFELRTSVIGSKCSANWAHNHCPYC